METTLKLAPMGKDDSKAPGPDFALERALISSGKEVVAGVDEAGRGPLAGPVVVAAVVLAPDNIPDGLNDSKKLSAARRASLFARIQASAEFCIVSAPPALIEKLNIRGATLWAMTRAVLGLPDRVDFALVDGRDVPEGLPCPAEALKKGDGRSLSIAAASILAKVTRDRMCQTMQRDAPTYGFEAHKGYGTARHLDALKEHGACAHHRQDFAPVRNILAKN